MKQGGHERENENENENENEMMGCRMRRGSYAVRERKRERGGSRSGSRSGPPEADKAA